MSSSLKYFYTVVFLDNWKASSDKGSQSSTKRVQLPVLKTYEFGSGTESEVFSWQKVNDTDIVKRKLVVKCKLKFPFTIQVWDGEGNTLVYCPLLNSLKQSIVTKGNVVVDNSTQFSIIFNQDDCPIPEQGQVYTISIKTVPEFDTRSERIEQTDASKRLLEQTVGMSQTGLAMVFRRNNLDSLYDLIADIDESYFHSMVQGYDLKYMMQQSKFQNCKMLVKYTSNLQDVIDQIDSQVYQTKFSWNI